MAITQPTIDDFSDTTVMRVIRKVVNYLVTLIPKVNEEIANVTDSTGERLDTVEANVEALNKELPTDIRVNYNSSTGNFNIDYVKEDGDILTSNTVVIVSGSTGEVTIVQNTSGISINGIALQSATTARPGLMTPALVSSLNNVNDTVNDQTIILGEQATAITNLNEQMTDVVEAIPETFNGMAITESATGVTIEMSKSDGMTSVSETIPIATTEVAGVMSPADKAKLDSVGGSSGPNENPYDYEWEINTFRSLTDVFYGLAVGNYDAIGVTLEASPSAVPNSDDGYTSLVVDLNYYRDNGLIAQANAGAVIKSGIIACRTSTTQVYQVLVNIVVCPFTGLFNNTPVGVMTGSNVVPPTLPAIKLSLSTSSGPSASISYLTISESTGSVGEVRFWLGTKKA